MASTLAPTYSIIALARSATATRYLVVDDRSGDVSVVVATCGEASVTLRVQPDGASRRLWAPLVGGGDTGTVALRELEAVHRHVTQSQPRRLTLGSADGDWTLEAIDDTRLQLRRAHADTVLDLDAAGIDPTSAAATYTLQVSGAARLTEQMLLTAIEALTYCRVLALPCPRLPIEP